MVFSPVDKVFRIIFQLVRDLPYAVVLGAAFMQKHQGAISFREKKGFRPTSKSTWTPFSLIITKSAALSKDVTAAWTAFCTVRSTADNDPNLEDSRYAISKCLAKANEDSLGQVVHHLLRSACGIIKE